MAQFLAAEILVTIWYTSKKKTLVVQYVEVFCTNSLTEREMWSYMTGKENEA